MIAVRRKMNKKQKLKLFWTIAKIINKDCCNNRLQIKKIVLFNGRKSRGYYTQNTYEIGLRESEPVILLIETLAHELAHAYQFQFYNNYYEAKFLKYKNLNEAIHDRRCCNLCRKFLFCLDKEIK